MDHEPELRYWAGRRTYSSRSEWAIAIALSAVGRGLCPAYLEHVQAGIFASRIRSSLHRKSPHGYGRRL